MTIFLTGGGSGGHITPLLAVAAQLKATDPTLRLVYLGQRGDKLGDIPANDPNIDAAFTVRAGKFRRYHGEGFKQLLDVPTLVKNIRDLFFVIIGFFQSRKLIKREQPSVVFVRGGFVGVPVGWAAASKHVPYITHDSDSIPSLANRMIAKWASVHAVALPEELYSYPRDKTVNTGIPLQKSFVPVSKTLKRQYRAEISVPADAKLLFVIGGGLGSQRVNAAIADALPHLLLEHKDLYVVQQVGRANEADIKAQYAKLLSQLEQGRVRVFGFMDDVYRYSGAADIVITRAGATNLAEFALQGKACIIIPSPFLTGGHQLRNAQYLENQGAAVVLNEVDLQADSNRLTKLVSDLLRNPQKRAELEGNVVKFARSDAAVALADLILKQGAAA